MVFSLFFTSRFLTSRFFTSTIAILTITAQTSQAGFSQIKTLLQTIGTLQNDTNVNPGFRNLDQTLGSLDQNYGCWCYLDDFHGLGKGKPIDGVDSECKTLHNNYECLILDTIEGVPDSCDENPWNVEYELKNTVKLISAILDRNQKDAVELCKESNVNDVCAQNVCIVEMIFTIRVNIAKNEFGFHIYDFGHDYGFQSEEECKIFGENESGDKSCCGEYPTRKSFRPNAGEKGCCSGKVYSELFLECCDDGSVEMTSCD